MVSANELRIGNLILHCKERHINYSRFDDITVTAEMIIDIWNNANNYTKVPITEERLKMIGFKTTDIKNEYQFDIDESSCFVANPHILGNYGVSYLVNGNYGANTLTTIHQLQNLYFAVTQKELQLTT